MAHSTDTLDVYIETGTKRTLAGVVDWPGWCRSGRDEETALQALFDYAPRYARVVSHSHLGFSAPADLAALRVVERVKGTATTDFNVPDVTTEADRAPFDEDARTRSLTLLRAYWRAFDRAVEEAEGKELRKGPRGGGRERDGIMQHVVGADANYLKSLAQKPPQLAGTPQEQLEQVRAAILDALDYVLTNELPAQGPRGGKIWTPRYFVRRVGYHVLDHAWEIEDRIT